MFKVYAARCNECLFSKDKIVSDERRAQILAECKRKDSHFICHKATISGQNVCCRGFYETQTSNLIRVMGRIGGIEFVNLPDDGKAGKHD